MSHSDTSVESRTAGRAAPSPRATAFALAGMLLFYDLKTWLFTGSFQTAWFMGALAVLSLGIVVPGLFRPFSKLLGLVVGTITWALSMAAVAAAFFLVLTPTALAMRLVRKDALGLSFDPDAATYWMRYIRQGTVAERLRRQF